MAERHLLYQSAERHFHVVRILYIKMEISEMIWQKKSEGFSDFFYFIFICA